AVPRPAEPGSPPGPAVPRRATTKVTRDMVRPPARPAGDREAPRRPGTPFDRPPDEPVGRRPEPAGGRRQQPVEPPPHPQGGPAGRSVRAGQAPPRADDTAPIPTDRPRTPAGPAVPGERGARSGDADRDRARAPERPPAGGPRPPGADSGPVTALIPGLGARTAAPVSGSAAPSEPGVRPAPPREPATTAASPPAQPGAPPPGAPAPGARPGGAQPAPAASPGAQPRPKPSPHPRPAPARPPHAAASAPAGRPPRPALPPDAARPEPPDLAGGRPTGDGAVSFRGARSELRRQLREQRRVRAMALGVVVAMLLGAPMLYFGILFATRDPVLHSLDRLGVPSWAAQSPEDRIISGSRWCFIDCRLRERTLISER